MQKSEHTICLLLAGSTIAASLEKGFFKKTNKEAGSAFQTGSFRPTVAQLKGCSAVLKMINGQNKHIHGILANQNLHRL